MIIDSHMHWMPSFFYTDKDFFNACMRCYPRGYGYYVKQYGKPETGIEQIIVQQPKGYDNLNYGPDDKDADMEGHIKAMDKVGIDKAALRWCIFPEYLTLELCKKANDDMAETVKKYPGRFLNLAIVPPWDNEDCFEELDRCINDLGCVGVDMQAHYGNLYLDAEEFRPFFNKVNDYDIPVIVHHTPLPVDYQSIYEYPNMRRQLGRSIDQITCVGRILYSGMLDELPNLKFIHSMMGGGLFAFADLITPKKSTISEDRERFNPEASDKVRCYLKRNIFCDMTIPPAWGKAQLECAVKVLGAENIVFGTSYPLRTEWFYKGVEFVKDMEISEEEKELILCSNAMRLFKIEA